MKKGGVLHPLLAQVVASLGHGDLLVVADAGLLLPATLGQRLGLPRLLDERVTAGPHAADKCLTVIHSALAGGDCIDDADLPRVFDVAYRGSNDRVPRDDSSLPSGSGLGLAIAAGLIQAHRGTLSARNLDTGARFEVRLPLAD